MKIIVHKANLTKLPAQQVYLSQTTENEHIKQNFQRNSKST